MVNIQNIKRVIQWTSKKIQNEKYVEDMKRYFSQEDIQMTTCTWNDAQHHKSSGKCKSKIKTTIKYHFTSVRMAITKKIRNGKWRFEEKWTCILVGMLIGAATTENSMEIPKQFKNRASIWISKTTPGCLSEKKWKH